jgi:very-short-patch-repair endonuclease
VADDHRWVAPPAAIDRALAAGFTGCPCCAGRKLSVTNSFAARYPDGVSLWHPTRNGDLTPDRVLAGSPDPVWWRCPDGPDHEWEVSPLVLGSHSLAKGRKGCPFCASKRASVTNSVASHPVLAAEWHPTRNGDKRPEDVVAATSRKLWWRCTTDPTHEWEATGANRTRGRRCPHCKTSLRSILEVGVFYELREFFPALDLTRDKVVVDGVVRHVDLLLDEECVVIEVDGRYRHAGPEAHGRDTAKTEALTGAGIRVLRLREHPLQPLSDNDVLLPRDATIKEAADAALLRLRELGWANPSGVDEYLAEPEPRHVAETVAHVQRERPGKQVRFPGPATYTRRGRWGRNFGLLEQFVRREGHANVPDAHVEDDFPLGKWVGATRSRHGRGKLVADRVAALETLPGWTWDPVADQWEDGYRHLLAFAAREGHVNVPAHHREPDGYPLGSWVRSHRRPGGRRTMTDEQRARLAAVPGWTFTAPTLAQWERAFAALMAFAEREGHCRILTRHREDGMDLDGWVSRQRTLFHGGELSASRRERLEGVPGWSWNPQADAWDAGFTALAERVLATGSAAVPRNEVWNGYPLGTWVGDQRTRMSRGLMDPERRRRLEQLPGWSWDPHQDSWERHFTALEAFVAREGHARVPTDHVEQGLPLASWVIRHRQDHKAGKVPVERVRRLEAQPGWVWDVRVARWEQHFDALVEFARREGHARVPSGHVEGSLKLGLWVIKQRQGWRLGSLSSDRQGRLAAVPGWVWAAKQKAEA